MQELNRIGVARLMDWAPAPGSGPDQGKPLPVAGFLSQGPVVARMGLLESQYPQARAMAVDFERLPLKPRLNGSVLKTDTQSPEDADRLQQKTDPIVCQLLRMCLEPPAFPPPSAVVRAASAPVKFAAPVHLPREAGLRPTPPLDLRTIAVEASNLSATAA